MPPSAPLRSRLAIGTLLMFVLAALLMWSWNRIDLGAVSTQGALPEALALKAPGATNEALDRALATISGSQILTDPPGRAAAVTEALALLAGDLAVRDPIDRLLRLQSLSRQHGLALSLERPGFDPVDGAAPMVADDGLGLQWRLLVPRLEGGGAVDLVVLDLVAPSPATSARSSVANAGPAPDPVSGGFEMGARGLALALAVLLAGALVVRRWSRPGVRLRRAVAPPPFAGGQPDRMVAPPRPAPAPESARWPEDPAVPSGVRPETAPLASGPSGSLGLAGVIDRPDAPPRLAPPRHDPAKAARSVIDPPSAPAAAWPGAMPATVAAVPTERLQEIVNEQAIHDAIHHAIHKATPDGPTADAGQAVPDGAGHGAFHPANPQAGSTQASRHTSPEVGSKGPGAVVPELVSAVIPKATAAPLAEPRSAGAWRQVVDGLVSWSSPAGAATAMPSAVPETPAARPNTDLSRSWPEAAPGSEPPVSALLALLGLAPPGRGAAVIHRRVDVAALLREEVRAWASPAAQPGRLLGLESAVVPRLDLEPWSEVFAKADPRVLPIALRALLQQAVARAHRHVIASASANACVVQVRVDDDGGAAWRDADSGVGSAVVIGALSPAAGRDPDRLGLALAVVHRVAHWHGGSATVEDSPLGGRRVTLRWPVNGAPDLAAAGDELPAPSASGPGA
jgi:hypothetical protein